MMADKVALIWRDTRPDSSWPSKNQAGITLVPVGCSCSWVWSNKVDDMVIKYMNLMCIHHGEAKSQQMQDGEMTRRRLIREKRMQTIAAREEKAARRGPQVASENATFVKSQGR